MGSTAHPHEPVENDVSDRRGRGIAITAIHALTAIVMAVIIGFFAVWATLRFNVAGPAFVLAFLVSVVYLFRKPMPSAALGSGLYITALLMLLTPVLFYLPVILAEGSGDGAEAFGTVVGGILGLFVWGFAFVIFAIVTAAVGYAANRRATKKLADE